MFDLVGLDELEKLLTQTRPNLRLKKNSKQPNLKRWVGLVSLGWRIWCKLGPICKHLFHFYILQTLYLFFTIPFKFFFYYFFLSLSLNLSPQLHSFTNHPHIYSCCHAINYPKQ